MYLVKKDVYLVERNIHGAWVVYGILGVRQYYGYTKKESVSKYTQEAESVVIKNQ